MFFNGMEVVEGGSSLAQSKAKFEEFREAIEPRLETNRRAEVQLDVKRDGERIMIVAEAQSNEAAQRDPAAASVVLRLALVEAEVRYAGANGIRFQRQVVRKLPGGAAGKPLTDGKCRLETSIDLEALRRDQTKYLEKVTRQGEFIRPVPTVASGLLAVVGWVQDDGNKAVWHAVKIDVPR
jgi:hypothetical protein